MKTNLPIGNTLLLTLLACGLVACTSQESNKGGTGGSGAAGAGGRPATDGTLCPLPATPLITDFTYTAGQDPNSVNFGNSTTLQGSEFVYPTTGNYPLTSDVSGSNWHITGTVGDYSGFGLVTFNCSVIDASAYKGVQFKVSGTVGNTSPMTVGVPTLNDAITAQWITDHGGAPTDPGRCVPVSGTNQYYEQGCSDPTKTFSVSATPTVVSVMWGDFAGGSPDAFVKTPNEIIHIYWRFPWTGSGPTYAVDIVLDDVSFISP